MQSGRSRVLCGSAAGPFGMTRRMIASIVCGDALVGYCHVTKTCAHGAGRLGRPLRLVGRHRRPSGQGMACHSSPGQRVPRVCVRSTSASMSSWRCWQATSETWLCQQATVTKTCVAIPIYATQCADKRHYVKLTTALLHQMNQRLTCLSSPPLLPSFRLALQDFSPAIPVPSGRHPPRRPKSLASIGYREAAGCGYS